MPFEAELLAWNAPDHPRAITRRFVLYVGFKCNLRCQFCYYLKSIEDGSAKNSTYEELAAKIRRARELGKTEIDFTGGEATIHPDFVRLLELCRELGFETINVITNGMRISHRESLEKFVKAGLNEVLFSLHSYDPLVHDALTQVPNSQKKILQAIEHARSFGLRVRINTVVNKVNYQDLDRHLTFVDNLKPHSVNLIIFNPTEETVGYPGHDQVRIASYEEIGREVARAVDNFQSRFAAFNVRFLPFCYAKGRETVVRTYWQEIYERQEWDPILHWVFRKNWFFAAAAVGAGILIRPFRRTHLGFGRKNLYTLLAEYFQLARVTYLFRYQKDCGKCQLKRVCPGLPRDFVRQVPEAKVYPYTPDEMPEILNPAAFGYRYPEKFPATDKKK